VLKQGSWPEDVWRVEVKMHIFSTLVLDGSEWSFSCSSCPHPAGNVFPYGIPDKVRGDVNKVM
jgi:hypothetical protein